LRNAQCALRNSGGPIIEHDRQGVFGYILPYCSRLQHSAGPSIRNCEMNQVTYRTSTAETHACCTERI
jgi:hypothetical protein